MSPAQKNFLQMCRLHMRRISCYCALFRFAQISTYHRDIPELTSTVVNECIEGIIVILIPPIENPQNLKFFLKPLGPSAVGLA